MENVFTDTVLSVGSLREADPLDLYLAFSDAFEKYSPKVSLTADEFYTKFRDHYHTDPDLSRIIRFRDRIAGFVLCTSYNNKKPKQAWISALGIRQEYRGRGWARVLMTHLLQNMNSMDIGKISLEVHSSNDAAISLFKAYGFELNKRIGNFAGFPVRFPLSQDMNIQVSHGINWPFSENYQNGTAVFQETLHFLRREGKKHITLVALADSTPAGCLIMDEDTGRIRSIFVTPENRGKGMGTILIQKATDLKGELRILNAGLEGGLPGFLEKMGFKMVFEQYEMVKLLRQ